MMLRFSLGFVIAFLISGCTVSGNRAIKLREVSDAKQLSKNFDVVMTQIENRKKPPRLISDRAEFFETATLLAERGRTMDGANVSQARLMKACRSEYESPLLPTKSISPADEQAYLRGWAVYCSGRMLDSGELDFYFGALAKASQAEDPLWRVRGAAINALARQRDGILKDHHARVKLVENLLRIRGELSDGPPAAVRGEFKAVDLSDLSRSCDYLEAGLDDLVLLTDMLTRCRTDNCSEAVVTEVLRRTQIAWTRALLAGGEPSREVLIANAVALQLFVDSDHPVLAGEARNIVLTYAPFTHYDWCVKRLHSAEMSVHTAAAETIVTDLITQIPRLRRLARSYAAGRESALVAVEHAEPDGVTLNELSLATHYTTVETDIIEKLLAESDHKSFNHREWLYGHVHAQRPQLLADHLARVTEQVMLSDEPTALQHAEYLTLSAAAQDSPTILGAQARLLGYNSPRIRDWIARDFLNRGKASELCRACIPVLRAITEDSAESARHILEIYFTVLASPEADQSADSPCADRDVLRYVFDREGDLESKELVVAFLLENDIELLMAILASRVVPERFGEDPASRAKSTAAISDALLLGDVLAEAGDQATTDTRQAAIGSLVRVLVSLPEEEQVHIARILAYNNAEFEPLIDELAARRDSLSPSSLLVLPVRK